MAGSASVEASPWEANDRYMGTAVAVPEQSSIPDFPDKLDGFRHKPGLDSGASHS